MGFGRSEVDWHALTTSLEHEKYFTDDEKRKIITTNLLREEGLDSMINKINWLLSLCIKDDPDQPSNLVE